MKWFQLTKSSQVAEGNVSYLCPWCGLPTSSETRELFDNQGARSFHIVVCGHATCGKPAMILVLAEHGVSWLYLASTHEFTLDIFPPALTKYFGEGVPANIARDFTEAIQSEASGFLLAAALVGRRVLQAAVRHKGGKGNNLKEEIDSLDQKVLSDAYKTQAHEVRLVGNDAAHANEVNPGEVEDLINFTRQVLD